MIPMNGSLPVIHSYFPFGAFALEGLQSAALVRFGACCLLFG